jgi:hypothetical protein
MPRPVHLRIDSSDRDNRGSSTPGNFIINSQEQFRGKWRLMSIYFPISAYNVNANFNNRIYFNEGGVSKIATITPGYYSLDDAFLTAIKSALDTASAGVNTFTVAQASTTGLISITASTVPFSTAFGNGASYSAAELLGFTQSNSDSNLVQSGTLYPNLATLRTINVTINEIYTYMTTKNQNYSTFMVPVNSDSPGVVYWEPTEHFPQEFDFPTGTTTLRIRVTDDNGQIINQQSEWHMVWRQIWEPQRMV